jgi:hypothetical protein
VLSDVERETLLQWSRRAKTSPALRCRVVLACAQGRSNKEVAAEWGYGGRRWVSSSGVCGPAAGKADR